MKQSALASSALALGAPAFAKPSKPVLATIQGDQVSKNVQQALVKLLEPWGGMGYFVKKGQTVLLKPNMGFPTPPEQKATTSPELVAAVAREVLKCGASRVLILDNPLRRPEACLRLNGIQEATRGLNVHVLLPTNERRYVETAIPKGKVLLKTRILKEALEVDVHIPIPIAKSHNATGFTGCLKGMMGLILDRESFHSRYELNQAIADLNTILVPQLVILDGLQVMATDGPTGPGEIVDCHTLVAGTDPVAVDAKGVVLSPLYRRKLKGSQIRHLRAAQELGLGQIDPPADQVVDLKF